MQAHLTRAIRHALATLFFLFAIMVAGPSLAAPYAAFVMDARNGEVIFARNHDTRLHPASLTKMMTLYVAFEAIKHGEVTLDTQFTVSRRAAGTSCVCLGLRPGQRISLRYLLRAAALRSANDASVVIAEGISGSVEAFAERMTRTARAMGMSNTTFRNPHGLTEAGHLSTARDMSILGRQLYFDYPQYFNMFSRRSDDAGVAIVPNTNRRFLDAYQGADGIKTGFTRAAGFNLTASAKRGNRHIIATMFGGTSAAARNAHVAELMDIGFSRAPARVATRAPRTPAYQGRGSVAVAAAPSTGARSSSNVNANAAVAESGGAAKTIRLQLAVRRSLRPMPRPAPRPEPQPSDELLIAVQETVDTVVTAMAEPVPFGQAATLEELPVTPPARATVQSAASDPAPEPDAAAQLAAAVAAGFRLAQPEDAPEVAQESTAAPETEVAAAESAAAPLPALARTAPPTRPASVVLAQAAASAEDPDVRSAAEVERPAASLTELAQSSEPAPETVRPEAAPGMAEAPAPGGEMIWIGAADTVAGVVRAPNQNGMESLTAGENGAVMADVQTASLTEVSASRPGVTANPGIFLTASDMDPKMLLPPAPSAPERAERQAIAAVVEAHVEAEPRVVSLSTSDAGRLWGVSLGQFNSRAAAERGLITVKMAEAAALANGVSRIRQTSGRFEASFAGLTQSEAERACLRLSARAVDCVVAHP